MSRDLFGIKQICTGSELVKFMSEDPQDRVFRYANNLSPDEFDSSGIAIRNNDTILVICSMRATGAKTIDAFVDGLRRQGFLTHAHQNEIAVIGGLAYNDLGLLIIPVDIMKLMSDAEKGSPNRALSCAGYEDLFVLTSHAEAER